jgi:hypothetical protein
LYHIKLSLIRCKYTSVGNIVLLALEQVAHPKVHQLALNYAPKTDKWLDNALGLLERNYHHGDDQFVLKKLQEAANKHDSIFAALRIFELHPTPDALESLLFVYENTSCEFCRRDCVVLLEQIGILPQAILEECVFDASSQIRVWAQEKLKG